MRVIAIGMFAAILTPFCSYAETSPSEVSPPASTSTAPADATMQAAIVQYNASTEASAAGDYAKAFALMKPLSDQKYQGAMYQVAQMYIDGKGVKQNVQAGLDLLTEDAESGYFDAQMYLAAMYLTGSGVNSNYASWAKWIGMAYKQNPSETQRRLDGVQGDMNSAAQGWVSMYLYSEVPKDGDYTETFKWASVSAKGGNPIGEYVLGILYDNGYGTTQDETAASKLYLQSAAQDFSLAENDLAVLYQQGTGVPRDYSHALKLYTQAANHGLAMAQTNLCRTYGSGRGVPVDLVQAYKWCNLAASQGDTDAKSMLDGLQQQMTLDQINTAQKLSASWSPTDGGSSVATLDATSGQTSKKKRVQAVASEHKRLKLSSTGTGFYVTNDGSLVTNAHVVDGCADIRAVDGSQTRQLTLVTEDATDDLALLSANGPTHSSATFRDDVPIQIGAHIIVLGYPLPDVLSGQLTLTDGSVSALGGLGGAVDQFQFSAPIQPGNSGGPILDTAGRVTGMSVGKLNAIAVAKAVGDVPENVNFGINEATIRAFLDLHSVRYKLSKVSIQIPDTSLGQQARNYTVLLQCWK